MPILVAALKVVKHGITPKNYLQNILLLNTSVITLVALPYAKTKLL
jgi:hypothetical protein